ncbi:small ribosomal subunit protein uS19-like [Lepus europaeus]|uniref:small ribosomal subunit protein uS19-like n=1 Tax=Lepus europaeus TaxID=9983 RepID=UPI002B48B2EF|nr:small ribosomal subunit protein uS19-like [Lepus europaeus]
MQGPVPKKNPLATVDPVNYVGWPTSFQKQTFYMLLALEVKTKSPQISRHHFQSSPRHANKIEEVEQKKPKTFCKFTYRSMDVDQPLDKSGNQLMHLYSASQQQGLNLGLQWNQCSLLKRLRKAKKALPPMEKPEVVKAHVWELILPGMVGSVVGIYNGKTFNQVPIKPKMIGHYLGKFSITQETMRQVWAGILATQSSGFIPSKESAQQ